MDFEWLIMRELTRNTMKTAYVDYLTTLLRDLRRLYFLVYLVETLLLQETDHAEKEIF